MKCFFSNHLKQTFCLFTLMKCLFETSVSFETKVSRTFCTSASGKKTAESCKLCDKPICKEHIYDACMQSLLRPVKLTRSFHSEAFQDFVFTIHFSLAWTLVTIQICFQFLIVVFMNFFSICCQNILYLVQYCHIDGWGR